MTDAERPHAGEDDEPIEMITVGAVLDSHLDALMGQIGIARDLARHNAAQITALRAALTRAGIDPDEGVA